MGTAMSCNNIGMIVSPMLGGIVYDKSGKLAVFAIMIGLGAFDIALRLLMDEPPRNLTCITITSTVQEELSCEEKKTPDVSVSIATLSTTSDDDSVNPTIAPSTPQATGRLPGILTLLRSRRLLAALYGVFINECLVASLCAILPLFVHSTFSWTALPAGLLFLCIAIPAFAGPLAGYLSDRFGARWIAASGFCLTAPLLMLLRLVDHDSLQQKILLCALLTLVGGSLIFFLAPLGAECSFVAEEVSAATKMDLYASSFSLMNCSLAAAGLLGPLAAGGLMDGVGWSWTTVAMGLFCATGVVPCVLATGGRQSKVIKNLDSV
jgi:MFS family permease